MERGKQGRTRRNVFIVAIATLAGFAATLLPLTASLAGQVQPLPPVANADGRLGLCQVLPGGPAAASGVSWAQLAYNAGARLDRWELRWDRVEPQSGTWNFSADDVAVQSARASGLDVEGILIGTPRWAAAKGQRPGNGYPKGLSLPIDDPANLWAEYVSQSVTHYDGQIHSWEIWNEPDLKSFWMAGPDKYFQMLSVAYRVIKSIDPKDQVVMAGMVVPDLTFVQRVLEDDRRSVHASGSHGHFDVAAWHAYGPAKSLYTNVLRLRALLASEGRPGAQIWVTEAGFPSSNPNGEQRQAAYVLQSIAYAYAAGASRLIIYRASDDTTAKTWGLLSSAGAVRMGYVAYQVGAKYFSGARSVTYAPTSQAERFAFYEPDRRIVLLWNRAVSGRALSLAADQPSAAQVDWMGSIASMSARNGQFTMSLPGAGYNAGIDPAGSVVGGPPQLVIEQDFEAAGLSTQTFVPPVVGNNRSLVVLNHATTPATVQIAATGQPSDRVMVQLPSRSAQSVDLDLLAGGAYHKLYTVSASTAVSTEAVSSQVREGAATASPTWLAADSPATLAINNPSRSPAIVHVQAFGERGRVRARTTLHLPASGQASWNAPRRAPGTPLALTIRSTSPIVATPHVATRAALVSQPQGTWYAVSPHGRSLSLFNSNPHATKVDVRFIGSAPLKSEELLLSPQHSFVLPTSGADAVVVSASDGITTGYVGATNSSSGLSSFASTHVAIASIGHPTQVSIFNPSNQPAHVTVSTITRTRSVDRYIRVGPSHLYSIAANHSGAPGGVIVQSDQPVVAAGS